MTDPPPAAGPPDDLAERFHTLSVLGRKMLRTIDTHNVLRIVSLACLFLILPFGSTPLLVLAVTLVAVFGPLQAIRGWEFSAAAGELLRPPTVVNQGGLEAALRDLRRAVATDAPPPWGRPRPWSWRWLADRTEELAGALGVGYLAFLIAAPDPSTLTLFAAVAAVATGVLHLTVITYLRHTRDGMFALHRRLWLECAQDAHVLIWGRPADPGPSGPA